MLCLLSTAVTNDLLGSGCRGDTDAVDGGGTGDAGSVTYHKFVDVLNMTLTSVASSSVVTGGMALIDSADANILREVAVLYGVTKLAVDTVGRGTDAAKSLMGLSKQCYKNQFAARVASQQGLVRSAFFLKKILALVTIFISAKLCIARCMLLSGVCHGSETLQEFQTLRMQSCMQCSLWCRNFVFAVNLL